MEYIEYNGKEYPVKLICLKLPDVEAVRVSVESLREALQPFEGEVEEELDRHIDFYVDDNEINLDPMELATMIAKEWDAEVPSLEEIEAWKVEIFGRVS